MTGPRLVPEEHDALTRGGMSSYFFTTVVAYAISCMNVTASRQIQRDFNPELAQCKLACRRKGKVFSWLYEIRVFIGRSLDNQRIKASMPLNDVIVEPRLLDHMRICFVGLFIGISSVAGKGSALDFWLVGDAASENYVLVGLTV